MSRSRQEFDRKTRAAIILRATRGGIVLCEGCGLTLGKKPFQIDHTLPEGLRSVEKKLTAEDGRLLGQACCHKPKTAEDKAQIAKMKRQRDKASGAVRPKQSIPCPPKQPKPAPKAMPPRRNLFMRSQTP